jgi:maleylpyruvate isomerase
MKLWSYWRSSCAYRVRIALGLKGLAYEYQAVHLLHDGGQQGSPAFGQLNPHRQVPVLEVEEDGKRLNLVQSMAIIEYLDERYPNPPLLPAGASDRAHVRALAELVNSGIQPLQNIATFNQLKAQGGNPEPWAKHFIASGLGSLEALASARAGQFLFGDTPTLADVYLVPQIYNARRFNLPLEAYPTLVRADRNAQALEAFKAAHPSTQPDAEPV